MNENSLRYDILKQLINQQQFEPEDLYSSLQLENFKPSMEEGLRYIYQYALSLSFPNAITIDLNEKDNKIAREFLDLFKIICIDEIEGNYDTFLSQYPFKLLSEKHISEMETDSEYRAFISAFKQEYVYEMMKLNRSVTKHSTIEHIVGVHYLAMFIAYQLYDVGVPIDLGRVSGAAAGHDIGKFGTRPEEEKRVAYYHYYYTDQWFRERKIDHIRNIAVNHSTWDLELDNLSIESLVLIYSDFRVKGIKGSKYKMSFYSLDKAFQVILDKLDNVDQLKERRYKKVYQKLKDFENYMIHLGVKTEIDSQNTIAFGKSACLLNGEEITQEWIYRIVGNNILTMHELRDEDSLKRLIERARGEEDSFSFRRYIDIINSYYRYMFPKQKIITIDFLFENLVHPEEDIRKQSAELIGNIILSYDETYKKETPPSSEKIQVNYIRMDLIKKLFDQFIYFDIYASDKKIIWLGRSIATSVEVILKSKEECCSDVIDYILSLVEELTLNEERHRAILDVIASIPKEMLTEDLQKRVVDYLHLLIDSENHLTRHMTLHVAKQFKLDIDESLIDSRDIWIWKEKERISHLDDQGIYLSNLKSGTPWIDKIYHIDYLMEKIDGENCSTRFYLAIHLSNLIKVSEDERVRNHAGNNILALSKGLSKERLNDLVIELLRALELDGYQFAKFIPQYLGDLIVNLDENEFTEVIDDFKQKIRVASAYLRDLLLKTVGEMIVYIHKEQHFRQKDLLTLYGLLMIGLVNRKGLTHHRTLEIIGKDILGNDNLSLEIRTSIFKVIAKKALSLIDSFEKENFYLTGMVEINRMLSDYRHLNGPIKIDSVEEVAYFSGTFDPFSMGQKRVADALAKMGMDVYIAVDEFNWRRRTQPTNLRRKIIELSTAEHLNIFMFPSDEPINIAQENSLKRLKDTFEKQKVNLVVGEDLIAGHPAYGKKKHCINEMPHIIIRRTTMKPEKRKIVEERLCNMIFKELSIDVDLEKFGSSHIRKYIANHWDLSELVDPLAVEVIFEKNMYQGEPEYKRQVKNRSMEVIFEDNKITIQNINTLVKLSVLSYDVKDDWMVIKEISGEDEEQLHDFKVSILTESFVWAINKGIKGAIIKDKSLLENHKELFKLFNFICEYNQMIVSFEEPMVLILDAQSMLKQAYRKNYYIRESLSSFRKQLIENINRLFPGKLLLLMDHTFMYEHILEILEKINKVDDNQLGETMIVPYGDLFNRWTLPKAITKSLHVERCYNREAESFKIMAHPNYLKVREQAKVVKAFNRDVILVDDILNRGYRLEEILPYLKREDVKIDGVVVGILTDLGKKVADPLEVHAAYRLKDISAWFVESQMMPFIGGETLVEDKWPETTLLPSVNKILPYMYIDIVNMNNGKNYYNLSESALVNTIEFMKVIEDVYLQRIGKKLTVADIGEIIVTPRFPEKGSLIEYDGESPTDILNEDLAFLKRFQKMF